MALAVSIVSHGHAAQVRKLLALLSRPGATPIQRVWLTLNLPEPELASWVIQPWPFNLQLLVNSTPLGFGANHNQAFAREASMPSAADRFAVLNPDYPAVRPISSLLAALDVPSAGCAFPLQLDTQGQVQDHRRAAWPLACCIGTCHGKHHTVNQRNGQCRMSCVSQPRVPSRRRVRYPLLRLEDVDLSLRLQLAGRTLVEAATARWCMMPNVPAATNLHHLAWHVRTFGLWCSPVYRRYRAHRAAATIRA